MNGLTQFFSKSNTIVEAVGTGLLGLFGTAAFVAFLWGGFQYMFGDEQSNSIAKGKKKMIGAVVLTVIAFAAKAILNYASSIGGGF